MKARGALLSILVGTLLAGPAAAEPREKELVIQAGDRIRYRTGTGYDEKTGKATVLETGPDWLRVEDKKGEFRLEKSKLESLAVLRGKQRNPAGGAIIGFVPGALFGAFMGGVACDGSPSCNILPATLAGGGIGAVVGAGIGALVKTDRWQNAPLQKVRFAVAPARGGVRAALSLSF